MGLLPAGACDGALPAGGVADKALHPPHHPAYVA